MSVENGLLMKDLSITVNVDGVAVETVVLNMKMSKLL